MKIQIITDRSSWLNYFGYINILKNKLRYFSKKVFLCNTHLKLKKYFDVNIILSYSKKIPKKYLLYSKKNIKSQFNLLRIVDNDNYPAFFKFKKNVYIIKILKNK